MKIENVFAAIISIALLVSCSQQQKPAVAGNSSTVDTTLEARISNMISLELDTIAGDAGQVIVMETSTGKIKAMTSVVRLSDENKYRGGLLDLHIPNRFDRCAQYLVLLEQGMDTLSTIDTGNGIWKANQEEIYDATYYRGGYGKLTMARALEIGSDIYFAKALYGKFKAFQGPAIDAETKKLGWNPDGSALDITAFMNAIANDGKLLKPVTEGEGNIVIKEHITSHQDHIKLLQVNLAHSVTQGLGRKCKPSTSDAAALPINLKLDESHFLLDICGYFPVSNPKYTIFVSIVKKDIPASAGGMSGPLFARVADLMTEYDKSKQP